MEIGYHLLRLFRRPFCTIRRSWRRLYFSVTNFLMIIGAAVLLSGIWYFCFFF